MLALRPRDPTWERTLLYRLYRLLQRWRAVALGEHELHEIVRHHLTSTPPSESLLAEMLTYLRLRRAALERLRSVRRWQMMYVSQLDLFVAADSGLSWLPQSTTQVECLINASASWREWRALSVLAVGALHEGEAALVAKRLRHGLGAWRLGCTLLAVRDTWGPLSTCRRRFAAWLPPNCMRKLSMHFEDKPAPGSARCPASLVFRSSNTCLVSRDIRIFVCCTDTQQ